MIDTIAKRDFSLNGTDYAKGDTVPMPLQQFNDLEPTGLVERPATETKPKPAPKPKTLRAAKAPRVAKAVEAGGEPAPDAAAG